MKASSPFGPAIWNQPDDVRFCITNRCGGVSDSPFDSLNLAGHVGDKREAVEKNRKALRGLLNLSNPPIWLEQVHGTEILSIGTHEKGVGLPPADGAYTNKIGMVLAVMTADCMPILICSQDGEEIAAVHAGWRGLASGIVECALKKFSSSNLIVYLGPTIDVCHYEVGQEVKDNFPLSSAFIASERRGHWMFDMYDEAKNQFQALGVHNVTSSKHCTYCDNTLFSYRREHQTGRFASLIWRV